MDAIVKYGPEDGQVAIQDMPEPRLQPDCVILESRAVGVCGTDLELYRNRISLPSNPPVILGHEFAGVVVEAGSEVTRFKRGDRVVSETHAWVCGKCDWCLSGQPILCPQRKGYGYGTHGAFTRYVLVPERCLHRVPDNLSFEEVCLTEPTCVAHNAVVRLGNCRPGDFVVVIGPGPIGLFSLQMALISGAATTVVIGLAKDAYRLEIAKQLGADRVINSEAEDPEPIVTDLSEGKGAHLIIDGATSTLTVALAMRLVAREGQIIKIGFGRGPLNEPPDLLIMKQAALRGNFGHVRDCWVRNLKLMERGRLQMKPLISRVARLEEWKSVFVDMEESKVAQAIITPVT